MDRRTFLEMLVGFSAGAGTGFMLTPVNWKLMDDVSIWTQEVWPDFFAGIPERGKVTHADSVCDLCPGGCGITVRKVEDRVTKIEGREGYPVNNGGICPLGASGLQLLYGPWRVPSPVRRAGKRGAKAWEQITWEDAIGDVVKRLSDLRRKGKTDSVACVVASDQGTVPQLFSRFMKAYGSPNLIRAASAEDTNELAMKLMQGKKASVAYDLEGADFILSFGSGLIEGWGSPVRVIQAHSKWRSDKNRATVIQIEPRLSNTAAKADKWHPIKPGTETALALGLAHVIIKESLYDIYFIRNNTYGFNDWRAMVMAQYSPEAVSRTTGLSAENIVKLARAFAKARRPLAVWGRGKGTTPGCLYECMAVHSLNALVGNINKPGGVWARPPQVATNRWPSVKQDSAARTGNSKPRLDGAGTRQYPLVSSRPDELPGIINKRPGAIQVLLVHEADPYYSTMDSSAMAEAFDKIPFVVSFSTYFDETAQHADLILPNHHYLERFEDVPTPIGLPKPVLGLRKPVVSPQFNTRYAGDTLMAIASRLGGTVAQSFPWKDYVILLKQTLGGKWDALKKTGYFTAASFGTPLGKFEFYAKAYEPVEAEGDSETYPLTLIPVELMRLAHGAIGNPPFCTKTLEETELKGNDLFVEVNPKTAGDYGLAEGRYATLETPRGKAKVLVHLSEGIMPGLVGMPKGLGHTGYDDYLAGKGASANSLMGVVEDPISGLCATWGIQAKLSSV
ncbi:MAG: molybdopterin-dependent oxidoreductase [Desulfobacterales bacterium]|nr:molybdopterin-dependent oxidoreductase [Desulfobacterales bacterium]